MANFIPAYKKGLHGGFVTPQKPFIVRPSSHFYFH